MLEKYGVPIITLAAVVAGVIYLARELGRVAELARFAASHPAAHDELSKTQKANTDAIAALTDEVRKLAVIERRRWRVR
jgi:hypothetical protein